MRNTIEKLTLKEWIMQRTHKPKPFDLKGQEGKQPFLLMTDHHAAEVALNGKKKEDKGREQARITHPI